MNHKQSSLFAFTTIAVLAVGACQSDVEDDQERLQSLLRDEPLRQVPPGAEAASAKGAGTEEVAGGQSNIILSTARPLGVWEFNDCTTSRTNLSDSSFNGNTAYRAVAVGCTDGIENSRAVAIAGPEEIVYVPDQPNFTFESGVTVAGWFKPATASGTMTLFRKRDKGTSSFALLFDSGKFEFVVNIGNIALGLLSPNDAKLGVFQHVAATYDGTTARLYVDGLEVNHFDFAGAIPPGPGPLLIGNDGSERRFVGAIDMALFATHALTADEVLALTCFPRSPSLVVTPTSPMTPPGVPATIDLALTNHNPPACAPITFSLETLFPDTRLTVDPAPFTTVRSAPVPSGATGHMTITATPKISVDPGTRLSFEFEVTEPLTNFFSFPFETVTVSEQTGCHVTPSRELMIVNPSVANDPVRTVFNPSSQDARNGVWSFKHLMENLAPTAADAPAMVETMMKSYTTPQTINGFTVAARPNFQSQVLTSWPRTSDGKLDLARAPLRLQAIVNRFDLRNLAAGDAGEVLFVFVFNNPFSSFFPLQATMSFEYKLPATTQQEVQDWAQSFHALGAMTFGENYNAALQAITERIVGRGVSPSHPNGSAISAVHTNEIAFGNNGLWEMREFRLSLTSGLLEPAPLDLTPDRSFNNTTTLATFINDNQDAILTDSHLVPEVFGDQPFQAGAVFNNFTWLASGVNADARHHFARNTCNGCHSTAETGTSFQHIIPTFQGSEVTLSNFLTGVTVSDPVSHQSRTFNELARRKADLESVVCANPIAPSAP